MSGGGHDSIQDAPLVLVSNRGPVTYDVDADGERFEKRGTGGLVTALTGLVNHRSDTLWVASTMTDEDAVVSRENDEQSFVVGESGSEFRVRLVQSDPFAYDRFYNVIANPMLWFIQHYLWDLSNAPDIRQEETDAFDFGYQAVNRDLADAVVD